MTNYNMYKLTAVYQKNVIKGKTIITITTILQHKQSTQDNYYRLYIEFLQMNKKKSQLSRRMGECRSINPKSKHIEPIKM